MALAEASLPRLREVEAAGGIEPAASGWWPADARGRVTAVRGAAARHSARSASTPQPYRKLMHSSASPGNRSSSRRCGCVHPRGGLVGAHGCRRRHGPGVCLGVPRGRRCAQSGIPACHGSHRRCVNKPRGERQTQAAGNRPLDHPAYTPPRHDGSGGVCDRRLSHEPVMCSGPRAGAPSSAACTEARSGRHGRLFPSREQGGRNCFCRGRPSRGHVGRPG